MRNVVVLIVCAAGALYYFNSMHRMQEERKLAAQVEQEVTESIQGVFQEIADEVEK